MHCKLCSDDCVSFDKGDIGGDAHSSRVLVHLFEEEGSSGGPSNPLFLRLPQCSFYRRLNHSSILGLLGRDAHKHSVLQVEPLAHCQYLRDFRERVEGEGGGHSRGGREESRKEVASIGDHRHSLSLQVFESARNVKDVLHSC